MTTSSLNERVTPAHIIGGWSSVVNWAVWGQVVSAVIVIVGGAWVAVINKRGSAEVDFRNTLLARVASLEGRVAEQEHELFKERQQNLVKQREYDQLLVKCEGLEREVEELRQRLAVYEGQGKRK